MKESKRERTECEIRPKPKNPKMRLGREKEGPVRRKGDQWVRGHCSFEDEDGDYRANSVIRRGLVSSARRSPEQTWPLWTISMLSFARRMAIKVNMTVRSATTSKVVRHELLVYVNHQVDLCTYQRH